MATEEFWTEGEFGLPPDGSKFGITCQFPMVCPFHPNEAMRFRDCKLLHFSLREDDDWDSHAMDVVMSCPYCGYTELFGVAISDEHHKKVTEVIFGDRDKGIGEHQLYKVEPVEDTEEDVRVGTHWD